MPNFIIRPLQGNEFTHFFSMTDELLKAHGAILMTANATPGFPCRVSLEDAAAGEEVLLLPYRHHATNSPYQATGPIYVRSNAKTAAPAINEIPFMLTHRLLSLRGYDQNGMMQQAMVTEGTGLHETLHHFFSNPSVAYVHIHNAKAGCYNCVAERA